MNYELKIENSFEENGTIDLQRLATIATGIRPILINGIVEELKYSKLKVKIKTREGIVDGFLSDELTTTVIAQYWGKEVTIAGTAHFKGGGKSVIEISRIFEAAEGDQYFSRKPKAETVEQQINRQLKEILEAKFASSGQQHTERIAKGRLLLKASKPCWRVRYSS